MPAATAPYPTPVVVEAVTSEDIKALRTADSVIFRHYKDRTTVEALLREGYTGNPRIFTASEQRLFPSTKDYCEERGRVMFVTGNVFWYESDSRRSATASSSAFAMVSSAQYDDVWKTIASMLRVGDDLVVHFIGGAHSNGHTKDANLHADEMRLEIRRGDKRLVFVVQNSVGTNNSARMVQPVSAY